MLSENKERFRLTWVLAHTKRKIIDSAKYVLFPYEIGETDTESGKAFLHDIDGTVWEALYDNLDDWIHDYRMFNKLLKEQRDTIKQKVS